MGSLNKRFPVYGKLLKLYPLAYQKEYGREMMQTLADMLDDPAHNKTIVWARAIIDLPLSVMYQQVSYTGGAMKQDVPDYMKRNAIIGAILLAPFFIVIVTNSLISHDLPSSLAWQRLFWVLLVLLPLVAFALNISTFLRWTSMRRRRENISFWKSLFDVRHNWLTLITAGLALLIALFVPFHDSTHCITGNPVNEATHLHQTFNCIRQG